jgi:hypothetical protein
MLLSDRCDFRGTPVARITSTIGTWGHLVIGTSLRPDIIPELVEIPKTFFVSVKLRREYGEMHYFLSIKTYADSGHEHL